MDFPQFTAEPSSSDTVERDFTVGAVPGLRSSASGADRVPLAFDVIIAGCGPTGAMLAAELRLMAGWLGLSSVQVTGRGDHLASALATTRS